MPGGRRLGFTALIDGVSRPFAMDVDGRSKQDLSGGDAGFAYGYSTSPDGRQISYHENYQIYVADADGSKKRRIETGHPFNFMPRWSPDGEWLLFVSGQHEDCHPHVVRRDGSGLRKLADRGGYRGAVEFLDVFDFHGGSSDTPAWSADGREVFFTAQVDDAIELFRVALTGKVTRVTKTAPGSWHYHPTPSSDGRWVAFGAKRDGARNLYLFDLDRGREFQLTHEQPGRAAMWPFWQPLATPPSAGQAHGY
jgi:TolB protein